MKKFICLLLALSLVFTGGCAGAGSEKENDEKIIIATSFYPIYIFTLNIVNGIDAFEVRCMAEQNIGCLHDYTLTSKDVRLLNDADAFVINGAGMESFIEDAYKNVESLFVVDSSMGIELICDEETEESHGSEVHSHEEDSHSHDHSVNAHIWLSVVNAEKQIENIKDGLSERFPEYSEQLSANYENYVGRLSALEDIQEGYASEIKGKRVITFHKAYDYLAKAMGFEIITCIESDEGGEPSAKKLAELTKSIKNEDIKALFTEPQYTGSAADILENETDIKVVVLNPVTSGEAELTAYENIMKENFELILKAVK